MYFYPNFCIVKRRKSEEFCLLSTSVMLFYSSLHIGFFIGLGGVKWKQRNCQSVEYQCIVTLDDFCSVYVSELTSITYEFYMKLAKY